MSAMNIQEPAQQLGLSAQFASYEISHNAYYVRTCSGGLGLVGTAPGLVAGMEGAWLQVRTDKEL